MTLRQEALEDLLDPQQKELVLGLLLSARDVRIAVPCAVLNKGAGGAGSMVLINPIRRSGNTGIALEAGRWWRGAPTTAVHMDYRQVLQHANDDALRALHKKLMAINKPRGQGLARAHSVPGRILFDELDRSGGSVGNGSSSGGGGGSSSGGHRHRGSSSGLPPSGLQRTGSLGLPPSGAPGLRRTSSLGLPAGGGSAGSQRGASSVAPTGHARPGPGGLHRLSAPAGCRSGSSCVTSLASSLAESEDEFVTPEKLAKAAAAMSAKAAAAFQPGYRPANEAEVGVDSDGDADAYTPAPLKAIPSSLPFEDSAGPGPRRSSMGHPSLGPSPDSSSSVGASWQHPSTSVSASPSVELSASAASASTSALSSPFASTPLTGASPADALSCSASPDSCCEGCGASSALSRQPTFSQPYFAEFEDEVEAAGAAGEAAPPAGAAGSTTPRAAPSRQSADNSGSVRAAQLLEAQEQMTAEELHEVAASFNHVFVPPWAVPTVPQQPVVRTYREAGVQTGTGGAGEPTPVRHTHTEEDAADHFQAFMQHFSACLPHLAMALADMHLSRGGDDPTFVKSQFYFNSLLCIKDEMNQLGERLGGST